MALALLAMMLAQEILAQDDVTVITQVKPPYSPYLSDYVGFDNKIVITLINKKNAPMQVRLSGQVKSNTGVTVTIPKSFIPPMPIQLGPNQAKVLMGAQIKEYLDPDVLQFSGISKQEVVQGNGLPEGDYSFCVQALDYDTGEPRSLPAPSGCANFVISHYEPPSILAPQCNGTVNATNPQNILFTWTIPAGAPPAKMEYVLKIVEMFPQNIDPNQAMAAATDPPFFQTVTFAPSFLYGPSAPALEPGKKYAFRVTARNKGNGKELFFKNNGNSVVCSFRFGSEPVNDEGDGDGPDNDTPDNPDDNQDGNDIDEQYADPCMPISCAPQPLAAATPNNVNYAPGDEVKLGHFTLKITSLNSSSSNNLSGEGIIDAPIFRTKVKATFQGLKVNPEHKVYSGKAVASYDPAAQVDQSLRDFGGNVQNIAPDKVKALSSYVKDNNKYIEGFTAADPQGLPFAWKKTMDGKLQLVNIASMEFAPDGAKFNAFLEMQIPEAQNKTLAFGQKSICFHPTGLTAAGLQKLPMIGDDVTFPWGEKIKLTLRKAQGENGTSIKWDCQGYKEMYADGFLTFDTTMLMKAGAPGPVKATFKIAGPTWGNILGEAVMDPFLVRGMRMAYTKAMLDFSDTRNAPAMAFPANHNGGTGNDWRGIYLTQIKLTLPKYLKNKNKATEIPMANAIITKLGFTGAVTVQPVFGMGDGNIGGWAFSMEKFEIALLENTLTKGAFNGKMKIPIAQSEIGYSCLLSYSNQELKTMFEVEALGDVEVDMWGATLSLAEGSSVSVETVNENVTVKAVLNGKLTINKEFADLKGINVNIPNMEFEELTVQNKKPYLGVKLFKLSGAGKSVAGFPISLKPEEGDGVSLSIEENGTKAGLKFAFHIGLDGNAQSAISGGTAFTLWSKISEQNGKQVWNADKATLEKISIKASVASCDMEGQVDIYKGDAKFGDGFRGAIKVNFRPIIKLAATVQFGSTKYQSAQTYRYWYVDAMAVMGTGIPVFPGFGIYGFGGGAYHHMEPKEAVPVASSLTGDPESNTTFKQDEPGQSGTGVVYEPNKNIAFGFKATIVMGTMPRPNAFNGDITLEASFFNNGGLNQISLVGNGYFVQKLDPKARPSKENCLVAATVAFKYSSQKSTFDGLLDVSVNVKAGNKKILYGGGQASMHFGKDKWYIKLGEPSKRIQLTVLDLLDINSYFMVGKNSLPGMPPLPANFAGKLPGFNEENDRDPAVTNGSGFALGQQIDINTGKLKFLIFYAQIAVTFGYDISVLNLDVECEQSNGLIGMNGWYAQGQVYSSIEAAVGLDINLWFLKAQVELFQVGVFAALKAGLPNPTWLQGAVRGEYSVLNGMLSGSCTFKFKYGDKCDITQGDPFGGMKVIAELKPTGNDVSVFGYPEVVYNLPIGKEISVETLDAKDNIVVTTFRFGVKSIDVKNTKLNKTVQGSHELVNNKFSSLFTPDEMFDEHTKYKVTARIYGDKVVKGKWERIGTKNNPYIEHLETEEQTFTTGEAPENFPNSNIISTLPGRMQRYFHHGTGAKGEIAFNQYPSNIPKLMPSDPNYEYKYVARLQEIGAGSTVISETPLAWDANKKKVTFNLGSMKPKTIYIMQIVRKKSLRAGRTPTGNPGLETTTVNKGIGGRQVIKIRENRLKSIKLGDGEYMVYQYAFKTSEFSDFKQKFNTYKNREVTTGSGDYQNTIYVEYTGKEPLDWYDIHTTSYKKGSVTNYVEPNIRLEAVDRSGATNDYYWMSMKSQYMDYLKDPKLNEEFREECTPQCRPNPRALRTYPAANAYGAGSRLTNNSNIPGNLFPKYAVGLSYEGNGNATKLTNEEINASYWKGMNDEPGNSLQMGGGNKAAPKVNEPDNTVNKMVIRYDVPTVLQRDRKVAYNELRSWAGLNPSSSSMNAQFQGFLKYNSVKDWDTGQDNPNYWSMNLKSSSDHKVRISFSYDPDVQQEIIFNLQ